jgi:hypothetical protein
MTDMMRSKLVVDFLVKESQDIHRHKEIESTNYRGYNTDRFSQFAQRTGMSVGTYAVLYKLRDITYKALTLMWNQDSLTEIVSYLKAKSEKLSSLINFQASYKMQAVLADGFLFVEEAKQCIVLEKEIKEEYIVHRNYDNLANDRLWKGFSELDAKAGLELPLKGGCKDSVYIVYPVERLDIQGMMDCLFRVTVTHLDNVEKKEDFRYLMRSNSCRTRYAITYQNKESQLHCRGLKSLKIYGGFANHTKDRQSIIIKFGPGSNFVRQKYLNFDFEYIIEPNTQGIFYFNESVYAFFEEYISQGKFEFDVSQVDVEMIVTTGLEYTFQLDSFIDMELLLNNPQVDTEGMDLVWWWFDTDISKPIGRTSCNVENCDDIYQGFGETLEFLQLYRESSGIHDVEVCCKECLLDDRLRKIDVIYQGHDLLVVYNSLDRDRDKGEIIERVKRKRSKTFICRPEQVYRESEDPNDDDDLPDLTDLGQTIDVKDEID